MKTIVRVLVFPVLLGLTAALALGASLPTRLEGFRLQNQQGETTAIAPSKQATLLYMYRGDW